MPPVNHAAQNLRSLRQSAGLSQEDLAARCGISERTIRTLEAGRAKRPHRDTLVALAAALRLPSAAWDDFVASWRQQTLRLHELVTGPGPQDALLSEFVRQRSLMNDLLMVEHARIDARRRMSGSTHRRTFEVAGEGLDRFYTLRGFSPHLTDSARLHIVDCHNIDVGPAFDIPDWSARAWEGLFGRVLPVGEVHTFEWTYDYASAARDNPVGPADCEMLLALTQGLRAMSLEVSFDPEALPERVWHVTQESVSSPQRKVRELELSPFGVAQLYLESASVGAHGIRWDWDDERSEG